MSKELSQIATIQAGILAKPEKHGDVCYLQVRHFNEEGMLTQVLYPDLKVNKKVERFLLQDGDILFAGKGGRNFAAVYRDSYGRAIASPTFLVIRLNPQYKSLVLPDFLAWFINHPKNLGKLKEGATGTSILAISSMVLKDLEISFPSLEKQQLIMKIHELSKKEKSLRMQIDSLRETFIQTQLLNASKQ